MEKEKTIDFTKLDDKLKPSDVDFKVQSVIPKSDKVYCILVAYKDARVDQNVLDKVVGKENWQVKYRRDEKGILFCSVGINNAGEWIWKESNGTESFTESEKGEASDAFKRACFMWGVGRHLYDLPTIFITLNSGEHYQKDGKTKANPKLNKWTYIIEDDWSKILIKDQKGTTRFTYLGDK